MASTRAKPTLPLLLVLVAVVIPGESVVGRFAGQVSKLQVDPERGGNPCSQASGTLHKLSC